MLIGKNIIKPTNVMYVDKWELNFVEEKSSGETQYEEAYIGQVPIQNTDTHLYLGHMISSTGDNSVNIQERKKKALGNIRTIFSKLNSLNLMKYHFESAMILMLCMLRSSLLYSAETYYNLKENNLREIEKVEESFLRQLLDQTKGCPLTQLYLECGIYPARFEILKMRLLFLQYILKQDKESLIYRFFNLEAKHPTKGCWANQIKSDLQYTDIRLSYTEILSLSKYQFRKIVKEKVKTMAFQYLLSRQKSKGKEIKYKCLRMSEYLLPNRDLTIEDQIQIFSIRNKMIINFSNKNTLCLSGCGQMENLEHIYYCEKLSDIDISRRPPYCNIYRQYI